ncbi:MAG: ABC transporter ATP-binding protein [Acidobacteriia bacterium]|nr:ABC transporter ATP-binding protein [Terriglobia bacterium]
MISSHSQPRMDAQPPAAGVSCLELHDVGVKVGKFQLHPVSFSMRTSEVTAIVGPNGSGKSTLLKLVSGTLRPTSGWARWNGVDIHRMRHRERARQIAVVAQESSLHFPMTVLEYCLLARHPFLDGLQLASHEDLTIVRRSLEMTEASVFERRWMNELSGGERQRVILARALAQTPGLLLLDEPTLNLDVAFQMGLLELVERLAREHGMAVLMVTHELNLAAEFADHILLLNAGVPLAVGPPAEVLTEERLRKVFDSDLLVDLNPISGAARVTLLRGKRSEINE